MAQFAPEKLADYRDYLRLLIRPRIDPRLGAKLDASDIVQDAMCRAREAFERFRGTSEGELIVWLRAILESALLDGLRRVSQGKRDHRLERSIHDAINDSALHLDRFLANTDTTPSRVASKREQAALLATALATLPDAQRAAVELHHLQGLSLIETASEMARTKEAVAGLVRRGLIALKKQMQE